jgi:hypothetical protein
MKQLGKRISTLKNYLFPDHFIFQYDEVDFKNNQRRLITPLNSAQQLNLSLT